VIVVSHCLGGSREDYAYLGNAWAAHGYVSVHLEHVGSDVAERQGLRQKNHLKRVFEDVQNTVDRANDVIFALNQLAIVNRENPKLAGRLDLTRIGLAGHAFGSLTTLNVAGEPVPTAKGQMSFTDPRVKAVLAMSTPVPQQHDALDQYYRPIHVPVMHMTGTRDESPFGTTHIADRRLPYDHISGVDQYLITFRDADHMVYTGHKLPLGERRKDPAIQALVVRCSLLFWDAYLKDDPQTRAALAAGELKTIVGGQAAVEWKLAGGQQPAVSGQQPAVSGGQQL
jgi:predicted dienelactone hydrolase